jgi:hypothetical protein
MKRALAVASLVALSLIAHASPATALPTMIRLGYSACASCHYAPQGGGPLNPYGRAIDEAQSLRAGEYRPRDNSVVRALSWNGRIAQDLRAVFPMERAWIAHESADAFRPRLQYRNVTELPAGFAVQATITGETDSIPRPALAYEPVAGTSSAIVNVALLRYRISPTLELAAGRDQLPTGVNLPDAGAFFRSRNRQGYYDAPTQIKMYWAGGRHRIMPYAYGPAGNEATGEREAGGGALAEIDLFGSQRAVIGVDLLRGSSPNGNRQMVGAHTRLGFGSWGILAQHAVTDRERKDVQHGAFRQNATYAGVFWAAREWLVASAAGERLSVQAPFKERLNAGKFDVSARLTSVASVAGGAKIQRDLLTRRVTTSVIFQLILKTVY